MTTNYINQSFSIIYVIIIFILFILFLFLYYFYIISLCLAFKKFS